MLDITPLEHICVDLETLSTRSNAVIVTIAAVKFNFVNDKTDEFCVNINPLESKALGLHISKETLDWWRVQKPEATKAWMNSQIGLSEALDEFDAFCGNAKYTNFWSQGINFDFPIMESSYHALARKEPYKYWNLHDMRTAFYLAGMDTKLEDRVGTYHNAIDDCLTQISWLKKALGTKT